MSGVETASIASVVLSRVVKFTENYFGMPGNAPRQIQRLRQVLEALQGHRVLREADHDERVNRLVNDCNDFLEKTERQSGRENPPWVLFWTADAEARLEELVNALTLELEADRLSMLSAPAPGSLVPVNRALTFLSDPETTLSTFTQRALESPLGDLKYPKLPRTTKFLPATLRLENANGRLLIDSLRVYVVTAINHDETRRLIRYEAPDNETQVTHILPQQLIRVRDTLDDRIVLFVDRHYVTIRNREGYKVYDAYASYEFDTTPDPDDFLAHVQQRTLHDTFFALQVLHRGTLVGQLVVVRFWGNQVDYAPVSRYRPGDAISFLGRNEVQYDWLIKDFDRIPSVERGNRVVLHSQADGKRTEFVLMRDGERRKRSLLDVLNGRTQPTPEAERFKAVFEALHPLTPPLRPVGAAKVARGIGLHGQAQSAETGDSTFASQPLSQEDREKIARLLCSKIRREIPDISCIVGTAGSHPDIQRQMAAKLEAFVKTIEAIAPEKAKKRVLEAIGDLRNDIAGRCRDALLLPERQEEVNFEGMAKFSFIARTGGVNGAEKWTAGGSMASDNPLQAGDTPDASGARDRRDPAVQGINLEYVIEHLTAGMAFRTLVLGIRNAVERFAADKLSVIKQRISSSMGPYIFYDSASLQAHFRVRWNLEDYLRDNYEDGISHDLNTILATTGVLMSAQLCTVAEYFNQVEAWKPHGTELLQALREALDERDVNGCTEGVERAPTVSKVGNISVDLSSNTVFVKGSKEFIVIIAQQLAWMAALTHDSCGLEETKYAYAIVEKLSSDIEDLVGRGRLFEVSIELENPPAEDDGSCWTEILGPSVLITGYPIAKRKHAERGLEASLQTMAVFAGMPLAVTFGGGFVFKGRYHAMVPIGRIKESIQWHVISSHSDRELEWQDILDHCPERLRHCGEEETLWNARSFFGWCPSFVSDLATNEFNFLRLSWSTALKPYRLGRFEITKFSLGFSNGATTSVEIVPRKGKGVAKDRRADDYEWVLRSAHALPVIFHGSEDRRAVQLDGEEAILHILLHRWRNWAADDPDPPAREALEAACPERRKTVRAAMSANANRVYRTATRINTGGTRAILFKQEVVAVYHLISGLRAWLYDEPTDKGRDSPDALFKLQIPLGRRQLLGFEYMELVEDTAAVFHERCITLGESCGEWHRYARDITAVPLFVENLGNVIRPERPEQLCPGLRTLPAGKSYLAVTSAALWSLFRRQGSLREQTRLTESGYTIFGRSDIFSHCPHNAAPERAANCCCCRMQVVVSEDDALRLRKHVSRLKQQPWDAGPKQISPESRSCILLGRDLELDMTSQGLGKWYSRLLRWRAGSAAAAQGISEDEGEDEACPNPDVRIVPVLGGAAVPETAGQPKHVDDESLAVPSAAHGTLASAEPREGHGEHGLVGSSGSPELLMSGFLPMPEMGYLHFGEGSQANGTGALAGGC